MLIIVVLTRKAPFYQTHMHFYTNLGIEHSFTNSTFKTYLNRILWHKNFIARFLLPPALLSHVNKRASFSLHLHLGPMLFSRCNLYIYIFFFQKMSDKRGIPFLIPKSIKIIRIQERDQTETS